MEFELNGSKWEIIELNARDLNKLMGKKDEYDYGWCCYVKNTIYINSELCEDRKRNVLAHELTHCWTMESGWGFVEAIDREMMCNISACSNKFVYEILSKYFEE